LSQFTEIAFTELFIPQTDPRNYLKNQEHLKQRCDTKKGIVLLVICEVIQHITAKDLALDEYYGKASKDWKPFRDHTIEDLLTEFERTTGFPTTVYYYDGFDVNDEDFMLTLQDYLLEKIFVVTDGLGINERSQKIAQMVDNQVRVGGLFIALDKQLKRESKNKVEQLIQQNFSKMTRRCVIHWKYALNNIELEVNNTRDFWRRLTNRAKDFNVRHDSAKTLANAYQKPSINQLLPNGNATENF
jgi:hypothetical protein